MLYLDMHVVRIRQKLEAHWEVVEEERALREERLQEVRPSLVPVRRSLIISGTSQM